MKIQIYRSTKAQRLWFFRIVAANNRIVAQSEGYKTRAAAIKTIRAILSDKDLRYSLADAIAETE